MSTILYPSPIFGPVKSRRLGVSLGINLIPADGKMCTFDCIYCECGLNAERRPKGKRPTRAEVAAALEATLNKMAAEGNAPDVLTFAGNGEPTAHPDFEGIIDDTIALRDRYFPQAKVSVLSNATLIHRPDVFRALCRVDNNILKLDTVNARYIQLIDRPVGAYDVERQIEQLQAFNGHAIIQTMFMNGTLADGQSASNLSDDFVNPWLAALQCIKPERVMIYTIARETPIQSLAKATPEQLDAICARVQALGIPAEASY